MCVEQVKLRPKMAVCNCQIVDLGLQNTDCPYSGVGVRHLRHILKGEIDLTPVGFTWSH